MLRRLGRFLVLYAALLGPVAGCEKGVAHNLALKMRQGTLLEGGQGQLRLPPLVDVSVDVRRLVDHRVGLDTAVGL